MFVFLQTPPARFWHAVCDNLSGVHEPAPLSGTQRSVRGLSKRQNGAEREEEVSSKKPCIEKVCVKRNESEAGRNREELAFGKAL